MRKEQGAGCEGSAPSFPMEKLVQFIIPSLPKSTNRLYRFNSLTKNFYLSKEGWEYKSKVKTYMPAVPELDKNTLIVAYIYYYSQWYNKINSDVKTKDMQNLIKILIDAVFERLGLDDSRIWYLFQYKIHTVMEEKTEVELYILPKTLNREEITFYDKLQGIRRETDISVERG